MTITMKDVPSYPILVLKVDHSILCVHMLPAISLVLPFGQALRILFLKYNKFSAPALCIYNLYHKVCIIYVAIRMFYIRLTLKMLLQRKTKVHTNLLTIILNISTRAKKWQMIKENKQTDEGIPE